MTSMFCSIFSIQIESLRDCQIFNTLFYYKGIFLNVGTSFE